jgi:hypothetical protein
MSPLGLLSHLSPSTIGMLASPPKIPGVPTLAELQKRADEVAASLPSYADLRGGQVATGGDAANGPAANTGTGAALTRNVPSLVGSTNNPGRTPSKPIPRVNLDPNAIAHPISVRPPGQQTSDTSSEMGAGGAGANGGAGGSWLPSWLGGSN